MMQTTHTNDVQASIAESIKPHPIVLFMKDNPSRPQCGFSATVVELLRHYEVPVHAVDVLLDPALRLAIKRYSDWPTIPQLYVNGAFIGGCEIVREMHRTGELGELIAACRVGAASSVRRPRSSSVLVPSVGSAARSAGALRRKDVTCSSRAGRRERSSRSPEPS